MEIQSTAPAMLDPLFQNTQFLRELENHLASRSNHSLCLYPLVALMPGEHTFSAYFSESKPGIVPEEVLKSTIPPYRRQFCIAVLGGYENDYVMAGDEPNDSQNVMVLRGDVFRISFTSNGQKHSFIVSEARIEFSNLSWRFNGGSWLYFQARKVCNEIASAVHTAYRNIPSIFGSTPPATTANTANTLTIMNAPPVNTLTIMDAPPANRLAIMDAPPESLVTSTQLHFTGSSVGRWH
jgi:hypothetical protein